jgi:hypothetical protein
VIKTLDSNSKQIKGSDVKMLEEMLWHLGMSPSKNPGYRAKRLTGTKLKEFGVGTDSVALMMGRFNYTNFGWKAEKKGISWTNTKQNTSDYVSSGSTKPGIYSVIKRLGQHWKHYFSAYTKYKTTPKFAMSNLTNTQLDKAVTIFDGGDFLYPDDYQEQIVTYTFKPSYIATTHALVSKYGSFHRRDILKAMASKEASSLHWGSVGNHRMMVGGWDELHSKGFNQIQNLFTYGARSSQGDQRGGPRCHYVSAYTQSGKSVINHYDPVINIIAKAAFAAGGGGTNGGGDCGRSFYVGFHLEEYTAKHDLAGTVLRKTIMGTEPPTIVTDNKYSDDTYEVLVKALGGYNQGAGTFNDTTSWSELLLTKSVKGKSLQEKAMRYGLDILKNTNVVNGVNSNHGIGLPLRSYIWEGAAEVPENPATPELEYKAAWCFAYGEEEWVAGKKFEKTKTNAIGTALKPAVGRINCATGAAL